MFLAPLLPTNKPRSDDSSQNGGDGATPPTGDTESVPDYLTNLSLSDFVALPGEDVQMMTPDILSGMSNGNINCLRRLRSQETPMARLKSDTGDSVLHLAATWGHLELVKEIVNECPRLLLEPNSSGQTPLHVAAHGGHTPVVKVFVEVVNASASLCTEESQRLNPYVLKDEDGNAALYYAIEGRYKEMATLLVNANKDAPFLGNKKGISSLYMAVEAGEVSLVKEILKTTGNEDFEVRKSKLQGSKHLAHVALQAKRLGLFFALTSLFKLYKTSLRRELPPQDGKNIPTYTNCCFLFFEQMSLMLFLKNIQIL